MKQPTIAKAIVHAVVSKRTWKLVIVAWLVSVATFAILATLGVVAGARVANAIDYLGHMTGLCTVSVTIVCVAFRAYYGYQSAMRAWNAQKRTRRLWRRCRRGIR